MSTKYVYKICLQNVSTKYVYKICLQNMSTKYVYKMCLQNVSTKSVFLNFGLGAADCSIALAVAHRLRLSMSITQHILTETSPTTSKKCAGEQVPVRSGQGLLPRASARHFVTFHIEGHRHEEIFWYLISLFVSSTVRQR
jgi:hypothetical protein